MPFDEDEVPESAFSTEALAQKIRDAQGEKPAEAPAQAGEVILEQPAAEPEEGEQPRDDKGRFATKEEPEAPEEPQELILGKFRSAEDLARSYQELERQRGEQSEELGTLRRQVGEFQTYLQRAPGTQPGLAQTGAVEQLRQEGRYQEAATHALYARDPFLYQTVISEWGEDEPLAAANFNLEVRLAQEREQLLSQYASESQPVQEHVRNQQFAQAWQSVTQRIPGMEQLAEEMLVAAQTAPEILRALESGTPADIERMIENLAWLARGRKADQAAVQAQELSAQQAEQNDAARVEAVVATASSNNATREEKSPIDEWKERVFHTESPVSLRTGLGQD